MESIDKLREYGHDCCARIDDAIHDLADAIEAEVADRYVALPLDADGVPIRVGDKLCSQSHEDGECIGIEYMCRLNKTKWSVAVRPFDWDVATWYDPEDYTHHAPTVEDVLRELLAGMGVDQVEHCADADAYIAEYAAKLRLAGDGE